MENIENGYAVVVTYNRRDSLAKCINCLLKQTYPLKKIIIIDNASADGTNVFLEKISQEHEKILCYVNKENIGGAGGFYQGINLAYAQGADWIWGMDDDAYPQADALYNLQKCRHNKSMVDAYWSNVNNDKDFSEDSKSVNYWMFVGFFLPKEIIKTVGFPRADFFIYYDDYEYADRITANGYHIWKVKDSIIQHQDAVSDKWILKVGNKKLEIIQLPKQNWKTYYLMRNELLRHPQKNIKYYRSVLKNMRRVIKTVFINPKQFGTTIKGFYHGLIGKSGKIMEP